MSPAPGSMLGRYRLIAPLGAGGMGEVWRSHDAHLDREVAIKILATGTSDDGTSRARERPILPLGRHHRDARRASGREPSPLEILAGAPHCCPVTCRPMPERNPAPARTFTLAP